MNIDYKKFQDYIKSEGYDKFFSYAVPIIDLNSPNLESNCRKYDNKYS